MHANESTPQDRRINYNRVDSLADAYLRLAGNLAIDDDAADIITLRALADLYPGVAESDLAERVAAARLAIAFAEWTVDPADLADRAHRENRR